MKEPNENILETLCFFCEYRIKSSQRQRFSTVIRKKIASANGRITEQQRPLSIHGRVTMKRLSIWDFILIFGERLCHCNYGLSENSKCGTFNHSEDQEGHTAGACGRIYEFLGVYTVESVNPALIDLDGVTC